ncbi:hypothetical protein NDU88_002566 [Pleurodeles waltl]|uniref:Uncharacterized protein n=1 Tax=Pleurodeles waltl TaxID=8319 RepID=A0AAV7W4Y2_PLEWA|nr:hypothetical protein NDU88_002566 [Pleurodeles waltl]
MRRLFVLRPRISADPGYCSVFQRPSHRAGGILFSPLPRTRGPQGRRGAARPQAQLTGPVPLAVYPGRGAYRSAV